MAAVSIFNLGQTYSVVNINGLGLGTAAVGKTREGDIVDVASAILIIHLPSVVFKSDQHELTACLGDPFGSQLLAKSWRDTNDH